MNGLQLVKSVLDEQYAEITLACALSENLVHFLTNVLAA